MDLFGNDTLLTEPIKEILLESNVSSTKEPGKFLIRPLNSTDFDYLRLLSQLTVVGNVSHSDFQRRFHELSLCPRTYFVVVIEDPSTKRLIGSGTLLTELKYIHMMSKRGHIEDVIVDESCRGIGLGKLLIAVLLEIGKSEGCYKVSLDCDNDKVPFYEKNGFKEATRFMCVRFDK